MKSVLVLTGLGLLSLVVCSCRDTAAPPPAKPPEVRVAPPIELVVPVLQIQEAESEYTIYSRVGPVRRHQLKKTTRID